MKEPIFLEAVFKERIWGGTKLRDLFGYQIPNDLTGECWAVSAHPHGQSVVREGLYQGKTLGELWENHKELFGTPTEKSEIFPLLTKILDASADLSVQVHPDDDFARINENGELGKTECWYILDAEPGAEIILGHHAKTKEELIEQMENGQWEQLLKKVPVKPGDFFFVPSGTIHGLGKGIVVLETQQSSDTTYRVYDYDRKDAHGNQRELHLDKAIQVINVPHQPAQTSIQTVAQGKSELTTFVSNDFFTVQKLKVDESAYLDAAHTFRIVSVIAGEGKVIHNEKQYDIRKGDHFIIPADSGTYQWSGQLEMIISHP